MATKKRSTRATARPAPVSVDADDDLGFPEEELEALFAQALADNEPAAKAPKAPANSTRPPKAQAPPPIDLDGLGLDDLDDLLNSTLDGVPDGFDATGEFEALDRDLAEALEEEDEDLEVSVQVLLEDEGSLHDEAEEEDLDEVEVMPVEEILALGDDGAVPIEDERDIQIARLRSRVHEFERRAALASLEQKTKDDRIEALEQQVVAATRQSAGITRELEAFRRRSERERLDLKKYAAEKVLKEFLVVFDNLRRALEHSGDDRNGPLGEGVEMTLGQFQSALRRCGVEEVASAPGTTFDPQWHEAVGQEFSDEVAEGQILHSMLTGFTLNERLLRAAMVTVSQGPAASSTATTPTQSPETSEGEDDEVARDDDGDAPESE